MLSHHVAIKEYVIFKRKLVESISKMRVQTYEQKCMFVLEIGNIQYRIILSIPRYMKLHLTETTFH